MLRQKAKVSLLCTMLLVTVAHASEDYEEVTLAVNHSQAARCGQPLNLTCRMSTGTQEVREMSWNKKDASMLLCEYSNGNIQMFHNRSFGDLNCSYKMGELTLTFEEVTHVNEGEYLCKLYSNLPEAYKFTNVALQDCVKSDFSVKDTGKDPVQTDGNSSGTAFGPFWKLWVFPLLVTHFFVKL